MSFRRRLAIRAESSLSRLWRGCRNTSRKSNGCCWMPERKLVLRSHWNRLNATNLRWKNRKTTKTKHLNGLGRRIRPRQRRAPKSKDQGDPLFSTNHYYISTNNLFWGVAYWWRSNICNFKICAPNTNHGLYKHTHKQSFVCQVNDLLLNNYSIR